MLIGFQFEKANGELGGVSDTQEVALVDVSYEVRDLSGEVTSLWNAHLSSKESAHMLFIDRKKDEFYNKLDVPIA